MIIRVKALRQPYRRAGFEFGRQWSDELDASREQIEILVNDPVLMVQVQTPAGFAHVTPDDLAEAKRAIEEFQEGGGPAPAPGAGATADGAQGQASRPALPGQARSSLA